MQKIPYCLNTKLYDTNSLFDYLIIHSQHRFLLCNSFEAFEHNVAF